MENVDLSQFDPRMFLERLYRVAVQSALPYENMREVLPPPPEGRTVVVGAGKAAGPMVYALESLWPQDAPLSGIVITRYHHIPPRPKGLMPRIEIIEAAHPVPDENGLEGTKRILELTQNLANKDLVIFLISGGGSSLLTFPVEGLSFAEKQRINLELLESGASIREMNCVRKHLSRIKGGRLAGSTPARVVTIAISDVPGDDPSVIASGPTLPDIGTCAEALEILDRHEIEVPALLRERLQHGELETPKPGNPLFSGHATHLIATPQSALEAAAQAANDFGITAHILSDEIEGEAREVGKVHGSLARAVANRDQPFARPCVILSGGETTVTLREGPVGLSSGRGGRAGEFCLGLAGALMGLPNVWALAADTDGIDGVEDSAGAFVTPCTLIRAHIQGMKLTEYMQHNDSYSYFEKLGDLLITGPTYTNVNDFRAILVL